MVRKIRVIALCAIAILGWQVFAPAPVATPAQAYCIDIQPIPPLTHNPIHICI